MGVGRRVPRGASYLRETSLLRLGGDRFDLPTNRESMDPRPHGGDECLHGNLGHGPPRSRSEPPETRPLGMPRRAAVARLLPARVLAARPDRVGDLLTPWPRTAGTYRSPWIQNIGASSLIEPLALQPGAVSTADAPPSTVGVFLSPRQNSLRGAIRIGTINVPFLRQNSLVQITQNIRLPQRPAGFPGDGGRVFLNFQANAGNTIIEAGSTNNRSNNVALRIAPPWAT